MNPVQDIVEAVAANTDRSQLELPPIYDAIDPDVVNAFVESTGGDDARLEFEYCDHRIAVAGTGEVRTTPLGATPGAAD